MITRSQSKGGEGEIIEGDLEIGSRICLRQQRETNMVEENPYTIMQEEFSKRLKMIKEILSNLVSTIVELQKDQDDGGKEKDNMYIGKSYQIEKRLPLKLEVRFKLKSFGGEMDFENINQLFKLPSIVNIERVVVNKQKEELKEE